ncbi:putative ABC multidrug transporter [Pterulicium gracile]|uniref:Putative ABC multidrug transporter n=1 Tax=Pterulicium gracile TaxID=1884261 RepID=A0A5C3QT24_9AGAR|nr:putative ABC multidrug transporter [Pterula gracilis]
MEKKQKIQILRNVDGLVRSGEMLIVLGRPGSGCTTFLKTLAGETHGFYLEAETSIHYQAEVDHHFAQLSVGDTLSFAARARVPMNRLEGVTQEQWPDHMRDVIMAVLGLSHTINTRVGDQSVRGVSGGERKRVSIAEMILSGAPIQCWDNITRGLDSANALDFVRTLRNGAEASGSTAIVAIYQAPQAAYDIFDKAVLLYEGRQIYFGRTTEANSSSWSSTAADFLTSLTNPTGRIIRPGWENRVPRTPEEFAAVWNASAAHKSLLVEIEQYDEQYPIGGPDLKAFKLLRQAQQAKRVRADSPYILSVWMQIRLCMTRGLQRLRNDASIAIVTIIGSTIITLLLATLFINRPNNTRSFYTRGSLLFFSILMNAFATSPEILTLYIQRPVVEKQSGQYAFYHAYAEALALMVVITSLVTNILLYFLTNLRREPGAFFLFLLFSFMCTRVMSMIFRTLGSATETTHQAMPFSAIMMLALITYTGFTVPTCDMRPWFRWIAHLNPIAYAFEAVMVNEFDGREFPCFQFIPSYPDAIGTTRTCAVKGAIVGRDVVSGTDCVNLTYGHYRANVWRNFGILVAFMFFFLGTYLFAVEFISAAKSKGEVLVYRRGHLPPSTKRDDEDGVGKGEKENGDRAQCYSYAEGHFMWRDVCYDNKIKKEDMRLLDHVDGWVMPGTLTALMGVSGAGKTTLLDVLASRVTMQQDLHLETSTVREALIFNALLRQPPETPKEEKFAYVEGVIELLDMQEYAEAVVVFLVKVRLYVEQRKRLTIAVELAAKPQLLLFLDEPTSGLDSQTAWSVCSLMRKLANSGQAILCTIHQPSAILFQEFDRLLFLAPGGKTVYCGEIGTNSTTLTHYFEKNGAHPCPPDANPAEWMLEVIGAVRGIPAVHDWSAVWNQSPERQAVRHELAGMQRQLAAELDGIAGSKATSSFAAPFSSQLWLVYKRVNEQYWRTPSYIWSKVFLSTFTALFVRFSFYHAANSLQGLQNQMLSLFMLMTVFSNMVSTIMPHFVTQRMMYEARERPSKTYSWKALVLGNIVVELPWQALMAAMAFVFFYYPVGLYRNAQWLDETGERAGLFFLIILLFYFFTSTFAYMIIAGIETSQEGGNLASMLFSLCLNFSGVLIMPTGFWVFIYRVSPFTYFISSLLSVGIAHAPVECTSSELTVFDPPADSTCGDYLESFMSSAGGKLLKQDATSGCQFCTIENTDMFLAGFKAEYSERWRNVGIICAYKKTEMAALPSGDVTPEQFGDDAPK